MDISKIITVPKKPSLYKLIVKMKNGVIVENLEDKKRFPIHNTGMYKMILLEEIKVFCNDEDVELAKIFDIISINKNYAKINLNDKSSKSIKKVFKELVPDYDEDKVFVTDMKKILKWYNILVNIKHISPPKKVEKTAKDNPLKKEAENKPTT